MLLSTHKGQEFDNSCKYIDSKEQNVVLNSDLIFRTENITISKSSDHIVVRGTCEKISDISGKVAILLNSELNIIYGNINSNELNDKSSWILKYADGIKQNSRAKFQEFDDDSGEYVIEILDKDIQVRLIEVIGRDKYIRLSDELDKEILKERLLFASNFAK